MGTILKLLIETAKVGTVLAKFLPKAFTETSKVAASAYTKGVLVLSVSVGVAASIIKSLDRLLTETVTLTWDKIKLVLNGITAGLWNKRPRVHGVWKRKSRNDTL
jgi:hypothetical protein